MKDTIKNSIIGAFALFGLLAIISGTTTQPTTHETTHGTPESHVWSFHLDGGAAGNSAYSINAVTGEVRKYNDSDLTIGRDGNVDSFQDDKYAIMKPSN